MLKTAACLALAALIGIVAATSVTCGVGLIQGTSTWCGYHLMLFFGAPIAIPVALVLGFPAYLLFRRKGLRSWWTFALGGLVLAIPVWYLLVSPIGDARWLAAGGYDSANYLGTGLFAGLAFWWLVRRKGDDAL